MDAPYEAPPDFVVNPFAALPGFRRCTQEEVAESECRDLRDRPSPRSARFEVSNETPNDVWVVQAGNTCTPFGVEREGDGAALTIELFAPCASACYAGGDAVETWSLVRLAAGEQLSLSWDGREAELAPTVAVCPDDPAIPAGADDRCLGGPLVPAPEGRYRASFLVFEGSAPFPVSSCERDAVSCEYTNDVVGVTDLKERCYPEGPAGRSVDFVLPVTGEVVVPVRIE